MPWAVPEGHWGLLRGFSGLTWGQEGVDRLMGGWALGLWKGRCGCRASWQHV